MGDWQAEGLGVEAAWVPIPRWTASLDCNEPLRYLPSIPRRLQKVGGKMGLKDKFILVPNFFLKSKHSVFPACICDELFD